MDYYAALLLRSARAVAAAASACRDWGEGEDSYAISDTAWDADRATAETLAAVAGIDPTLSLETYPETRIGRLVLAARLLVLAGTDERGQSQDLAIAVSILNLAAEA